MRAANSSSFPPSFESIISQALKTWGIESLSDLSVSRREGKPTKFSACREEIVKGLQNLNPPVPFRDIDKFLGLRPNYAKNIKRKSKSIAYFKALERPLLFKKEIKELLEILSRKYSTYYLKSTPDLILNHAGKTGSSIGLTAARQEFILTLRKEPFNLNFYPALKTLFGKGVNIEGLFWGTNWKSMGLWKSGIRGRSRRDKLRYDREYKLRKKFGG